MESKLMRDFEKLQKQNKVLKSMLLETEKELDAVTKRSEEESSDLQKLLESILPVVNESNRKKEVVERPLQAFPLSSPQALTQMLLLHNIETSLMQVADNFSEIDTEQAQFTLKKLHTKIASLNSQLLISEKKYQDSLSEKEEILGKISSKRERIKNLLSFLSPDSSPSVTLLLKKSN